MLSSANYNMPYVIDLQNCVFKNNRHIISICNNKNGFKYEYLKSNITEYPHTICIINTEFIIDYNINFNSENNMIVGSCPCQLNSGLIDVDDKSKKNIFFHFEPYSEYIGNIRISKKYIINVYNITGKLISNKEISYTGKCGCKAHNYINNYYECLCLIQLDTILNYFMVISEYVNENNSVHSNNCRHHYGTSLIILNKLNFNEDNNHIICINKNHYFSFHSNLKDKFPMIKSNIIYMSLISDIATESYKPIILRENAQYNSIQTK